MHVSNALGVTGKFAQTSGKFARHSHPSDPPLSFPFAAVGELSALSFTHKEIKRRLVIKT